MIYLDEESSRALFSSVGLSVAAYDVQNELATCLLVKSNIDVSEESEVLLRRAGSKLLSKAIVGYAVRLLGLVDALLADLNDEKSICFYGATNGLNNLLSILSNKQLICLPIYDSDSTKDGCFLPTSTNPIISSENTDDLSDYDRIYITAGSFQSEIIDALGNAKNFDLSRIVGLFRS